MARSTFTTGTNTSFSSQLNSTFDWAAYEVHPIKANVRAATTANITLSGEQTIDTVAVVTGDRVLVKNQTAAADNGIYVAAVGSWARAADMDTDAKVNNGVRVYVEEGTNEGTWHLTTTGAIVLGTTSLAFEQTGTGDVSGPASATDNALARFDSITGKLIQNSVVTVDDSGAITVPEISAPATPAAGKVVIYVKSDGKLYIKDDAGTETDLTAAGGGGGITEIEVAQTGHGLAVGNNIKVTGNDTYAQAANDSAANAEIAGRVTAVADVNNFTYVSLGPIVTGSGYTAGLVRWLTTAGGDSDTKPSADGEIAKPVLLPINTTEAILLPYIGNEVGATGGGSSGHTVEDEGTPLTARTKLNFVGAGVTVTDDAGDDATVVTIPGGDAFVGATAYRATSDQAISDSTATSVALNGEVLDSHAFHDNATNNTRLTVPSGQGGYYSIVGQVTFESNATGVRLVELLVNGSQVAKFYTNTSASGDTIVQCTSPALSLSVGDYAEIQATQFSGASLDVRFGSNNTFLSLHKIG